MDVDIHRNLGHANSQTPNASKVETSRIFETVPVPTGLGIKQLESWYTNPWYKFLKVHKSKPETWYDLIWLAFLFREFVETPAAFSQTLKTKPDSTCKGIARCLKKVCLRFLDSWDAPISGSSSSSFRETVAQQPNGPTCLRRNGKPMRNNSIYYVYISLLY